MDERGHWEDLRELAEEKFDKVCSDLAVLTSQFVEACRRIDDQARCIETLNHNSTAIKVSVSKLEGYAERNHELIEDLKVSLNNNLKTWLTVFSIIMTIVVFIVNYFKV